MMSNNRVVVITGATGGLGRVVARQFSEAGARLALFSSKEEHLRQLAQELALPEDRQLTAALDLRTPDAARVAAQATVERFGKVDILLNFIGGWTGGTPLVEVDPSLFEEMINQHVWPTFYLAQAFVPRFIENGWGRIVIISSPTAGLPVANSAPYAAAKAAQEALILSIAQEVKGTGITANAIRVKTIDVKHRRIHEPEVGNADWTTPEEIASVIQYLCSESAGMVNGARIPLYGSP